MSEQCMTGSYPLGELLWKSFPQMHRILKKLRNKRNNRHFLNVFEFVQNTILPIENSSLGSFKRIWSPDKFSKKHVFRPK